MKKRLQIGIIGSAGLDKTDIAEKFAYEAGKKLAERGHVLVFGPELQPPSLSTLAAKTAFENGGTTLAVALGRGKTKFVGMEYVSVWTYPDYAGGGGREVALANSCDGVIVIGGGVGTLMEIAVSYTNLVPIVLLDKTGGWVDKLTEDYLDSRKKVKLFRCSNIEDAVTYIESESIKRNLRELTNKVV
ncbi:hypothetical protein IT400_04395 [Candidatus Nomurabacteria bacterium]|nr:hypothetical protein [Candidatus Nomurabacteria bacterium]